MREFHTHYDNLKVSKSAPIEVIKASYRALCNKYHPDKNPDDLDAHKKMTIINKAYEVLSDPTKRAEHDRWISQNEASYQKDNVQQKYDQERNYQQAYQEKRRQEANRKRQRQQQEYEDKQRQYQAYQQRQYQQQQYEEKKRQQREASLLNKFKVFIQKICHFIVSFFKYGFYLIIIILLGLIAWYFLSKDSFLTNVQNVNHYLKHVSNSTIDQQSRTNFVDNREKLATYPTSFDCKKAKSRNQKLICNHSELAQHDVELSNLLKQAKASVVDVNAFNQRIKRQWNYREKTCKDVACLMQWFLYEKETLNQVIATGNFRAGLKDKELEVQSLPKTGIFGNNIVYGKAPLQIHIPYDGDHYFIKLEDADTKRELAQYFIRSGESLNTQLPIGRYILKYATGTQWYGAKDLFGEKTMYAQTDQVLDFNFNGYQYQGYTIELIKQINGNLHTTPINPQQF